MTSFVSPAYAASAAGGAAAGAGAAGAGAAASGGGDAAAAEAAGATAPPPPPTTAFGALLGHITGGHLGAGGTFQPMNVNFGLFPPLAGRVPKRARKAAMVERARADLGQWLGESRAAAA